MTRAKRVIRSYGSKIRIEEDIKEVIKAGFGEHRRVSVFSDVFIFYVRLRQDFSRSLSAYRNYNGGKE
jgi:hypothetical protein